MSEAPVKNMLKRIFSRKPELQKLSTANESEESNSLSVSITKYIEVLEHERWRDQVGWSSRHLDIGDPKRYLSTLGPTDNFVGARIDDGWIPDGEWYNILVLLM